MKIQFRPTSPPPQQTEGTSSTSQSSATGKSSPLGSFKTKAKQALQRVQAAVSSSNEKVKSLLERTTQKLQAMKAKITGGSSNKNPVNPYGDYPEKSRGSTSSSRGPGSDEPPGFKPESPKPDRSNTAPTPPPQHTKPPLSSSGASPEEKNILQAAGRAAQDKRQGQPVSNAAPTPPPQSTKPPLSSQSGSSAPPPPPPPPSSGSGGPGPIKAEDLALQARNLKPTVTNDRSAPVLSSGGPRTAPTPPPQSSKPPKASPPPPPPPPSPGSGGPSGPSLIKAEDLAAQRGRLKPVNQGNPGGPKAPPPTAPKPNVGPAPTPEKGKAPQFVMTPDMLSNVKLKSTKE